MGGDGPEKQASGVARAAAEVQRDARRSLVSSAKLKRWTEMPAARDTIAETDEKHRRGFVHRKLPGSRYGIGDVADVVGVVQREALPAGHRSVGGNIVAVVDQHSRADVKLLEEEQIVGGLRGAQVQRPFVGHPILIEGVAVTERVKPKTHLWAGNNAAPPSPPPSQPAPLHAHA